MSIFKKYSLMKESWNIPVLLKILICCFLPLLSNLRGLTQSEKINAAVDKQSFIYAVKDTSQLGLDIYQCNNNDPAKKKPCVIFVFGGAFVGGRRDDTIYNRYFNSLAEHGYVIVSISYRLGLRGVRNLSKFNVAPLRKAVDMAVDDVYDATNWIMANAGRFGIDTSEIILSGSSSGAITVLGADFQRRNKYASSDKLHTNFEYAGVIAFSGAVLSFDGRLKYKVPPAPTLMFHGTADQIVPYNKIRFFNKGFYGSRWIAKTFKEKNYPYCLYSEEGLGHEVSVLPMIDNNPFIIDFLDKFIAQRKPYQIDIHFKDPEAKPMMLMTSRELFNKLQNK